jgi:integrase
VKLRPTPKLQETPAPPRLFGQAARYAGAADLLTDLARLLAQDPQIVSRLSDQIDSRNATDHHLDPLLENSIVVDDVSRGVVPPQARRTMHTIHGPYKHGTRYRIRIRWEDGGQEAQSFATIEEARRELLKLQARKERESGVTIQNALELYEQHMANVRQLKPRSVETTIYRLTRYFRDTAKRPLVLMSQGTARSLYDSLEAMSVDSRLNLLAEVKTFFRWAIDRELLRQNPAEKIKGEGRRHYGKPKLTVDESRKYLAACMERSQSSNAKERTSGVVSAMPLIFGMRASEITGLQVRDLDADGTILRVRGTKSKAGIRSLAIPPWFGPNLQRLAEGKESTEPLVGRNRTWLHRNVRAICKIAGVPVVPPHGLRGTHADLALTAAATPLSVSKALGHESLTTTYRHYANEEITREQQHLAATQKL